LERKVTGVRRWGEGGGGGEAGGEGREGEGRGGEEGEGEGVAKDSVILSSSLSVYLQVELLWSDKLEVLYPYTMRAIKTHYQDALPRRTTKTHIKTHLGGVYVLVGPIESGVAADRYHDNIPADNESSD
jgi:hypothetical protein